MTKKRHPWKRELLKLAADLRKKAERPWSSVALTNLEQNIYWAFLLIRKILELYPSPDWNVPVVSYIPYEQDGTLCLDRPREQRWLLILLCNELIHSSDFAWNFWDDGALRGFLFCSSRREHRRLLLLSNVFIEILETIGGSEDAESPTKPTVFTTARESSAKKRR